ncbi:MAG: NAD-dependent epimerase/dehydratase family protein [Weeksellaceae bacterium]|jgi:nucleoside-diphosphate-sugar epimerase|nr:NAD-dependent epimerase/dehydratase family protein [Weeksellaceae bacterium]MDX9705074.1 NAD-dependent epimerase/dehydratase family protein [Weeksellaceae bacterium]
MTHKILVTGALGQIGSELTLALREIYGEKNVLSTDIKPKEEVNDPYYESLNVMDEEQIVSVVEKHQITIVYHLAAMLSATAEKFPRKGWDLNMKSLLTFLDLAKDKKIKQLYWPSSIAIFGPETPKNKTEQNALAIPTTVYGISKRSGEFWCNYYHEKYDVDVRSIRYPGLISWKTRPGGGTTDYAVDIFYQALETGNYECFLSENTALPMMYMDDAIRATIELMQADKNKLSIRTSYNLHALSFTPKELAEEIKKHLPDFKIRYQPDFRQAIADSWPASIDDSVAQKDWNWKPEFDLEKMSQTMLKNLKEKI